MSDTASILLVDDDPAILKAYAEVLRAAGHEVWEASTGQEGLRVTRERRPNLVLLDVMLPDLSGVEVCRHIKADSAFQDVFVVLFSGQATSSPQKVDGLSAGADDYMVKSVDPDEFRARVRLILRLRHTTAALRASEQHYRQLVERLPDAVILLDLQSRVRAVNPRGAAMLGYADLSELLGKSGFDLAVPEDQERVREDLAAALDAGSAQNAQYTLLRKGGRRFPAELNAAPSRDPNGRPSGFVLVVRDVTERKQSEAALTHSVQALRANTLFLQTLINAIPFPIFYKDTAGRYIGCNHAFEQCLGLSEQQIRGKTVYEVTPGDLAELYHEADRELLDKPGFQAYESQVAYADGSRHEVIFNKATFQDAEGKVAGVVGTLIDVTERKRAQAQVRLLADAVQSTTELICITDQENRFTFANRAFLETYGYRLEDLRGKTPQILYSPANPPGLCEQIFQDTLREGWRGELLNCRRDGAEFPISLSTTPIKNEQGRILGLVGVARDISERKRAEMRGEAFSHLGYRLSSADTREQAAQIIMDVAAELFGWDAGYVHLYSGSNDQIIPVLTVDTVNGQRTPVAPTSFTLDPSPLMRLVMKEGAQLITPDYETPVGLPLVPFGDTKRRSASKMFVPIRAKRAVIGILSIQSYTPQAYSPENLKLLQTLADHCGDALERIKVSDALREAEAKYRSIFENATEGILQTTPDGRFLSVNPALASMLGYQSPEELTARVTDLGRQGYVRPERRQEFKRLMALQGSVEGFELEHYRKDGSIIWVSGNAHAVRDAEGAVLYYEGTLRDITERKRTQEALHRAQRQQEALLNNIPDPAWLKDGSGHFLACNRALAEIYGRSPAAILGRKVSEFLPQIATALTRQDQEVMQSRRPATQEVPLTDAQGRLRWFEIIKAPVFDDRGEVTGTAGIGRDITERQWVVELLRRQRDFALFLSTTNELGAAAERLLNMALENEGLECGAVYLVNAQTNALELVAHRGLSANFAKHASRFGGNTACPPSAGRRRAASGEQTRPMAAIVRHLKREGLRALEAIPIQHRGHVVAVLNVGSRAQTTIPENTRQAIEAFAAQAGGAIARVRAEQSLHASRQVLEKTIHGLRAAVFIVDAQTNTIEECNPAATRLFGYGREELIGQSPALLHLNEATFEEFRRRLQAAVKENGPLSEFELQMKRNNGASFPSTHTLLPIRGEGAEVVTWVSVVRDDTQRKRTEQELRDVSRRIIEAQEAERQRVARELHDSVNQVIASAKMRLRKVGDTAVLSPVAREFLVRSDELLAQALAENRRIAHNLRPADLDAMGLADACRNFCREFQSRTGLEVKTRLARLAQRLPPGMELNLFRIVQEALNNIDKHAHARTVRLQLAFQRGVLMLKIRDDGRGFDPNAVNPARRKGEGIGLTNIRERAATLGGTCEVVSEPGKGTTITVRVPCQPQ